MDSSSVYYKQVQLLIQVLPLIFDKGIFALKGGTAINLFVRNMPRLSVDIDLVYLGNEARSEALKIIKDELDAITKRVQTTLWGSRIHKTYQEKPDALRLIISRNGVNIKVELSPVLRGTVFPPEDRIVSEAVEDEFGFVEVPVVSLADLYGGKICAALDRQHPRDLFDVKLLLENEGFSEAIRKATLVYIISHPKPISELLSPRFKDIESIFRSEFAGMTQESVTLDELLTARSTIVEQLQKSMTPEEKKFLISFKKGSPDWMLLNLERIEQLPAVKWKLLNLTAMAEDKQKAALGKLEEVIRRL